MKAMKLDRTEVVIPGTWEGVAEFYGVEARELQIEKILEGFIVTANGVLLGKIDEVPR